MPPGIPSDAVALAVTVTVIDTVAAGWLTAYLPGTAIPEASVLNVDGPFQTRAAGFIASVTPAGFALHSTLRAHVFIDVAGYFTGPTAVFAADGLFVPVTPNRVLDTRQGAGRRAPLSTTLINVGSGGAAGSVAANWTITETAGIGFVTAHAPGRVRPETSNVNSDMGGQTIANFGISRSLADRMAAFSSGDTHLLVDVFGWFTAAPTNAVIAAAGNLGCPVGSEWAPLFCHYPQVSSRIMADSSVGTFLALGDQAYPGGSLASYQAVYHPTYGQMKHRTRPVAGNQDYESPGAAGYFAYFGSAAGDPTKGYYSFDIGENWHVVVLNSSCLDVSCSAGSAQERWLRSDLAGSTRPCTLALSHFGRFSSGFENGGSDKMRALFSALVDDGTELLVSSQQHDYERFAPRLDNATVDQRGVRQFNVGTGGRSVGGATAATTGREVQFGSTFGYLRLTLGENAYAFEFVDEFGAVLDSGTTACR